MSESESPQFGGQVESTAILVLGMHRSGTSATTGALGVLGVLLGSRLLDAGPDNARGYWEHRDAVVLDERLLSALEMDWDDPRELPPDWINSEDATRAGEAIRALVSDQFHGERLWALKDPRLCRLLPLWRRELAAQNVRTTALFVLRHPDEIAASLLARDGISPVVAHLLQIRHMLEAERTSRDMVRSVIRYETLFDSPADAFESVAIDLRVAWPQPPAKCSPELEAFLDSTARHHVVRVPDDVAPHAPETDSPFRAAALELHALLDRGMPDVATHALLDGFRDRFEAMLASQKIWLDVLYYESRMRSTMRTKIGERQGDANRNLMQRLHDTETALAYAEQLCFARLDEVEKLDRALSETQEVATRSLEEIEKLKLTFSAAHIALAGTEQLCVDRLFEVEGLSRALSKAQLAHTQERNALNSRIDMLNAQLTAMYTSRSWRITEPLRVLTVWCRRFSRKGSAS